MKLAFITDEVTQNFAEAVAFARENGLQGLEVRSVDDTPADRLSAQNLRECRLRADDAGLAVCNVAGSFFKCAPQSDRAAEL